MSGPTTDEATPTRAMTCEDTFPDPDAPADVSVRAFLTEGVRRLMAAASGALQGDVEGVHQMRVATRRLRSDLRTFRTLIDPAWSKPLVDELRWLGRVLGDVRDLDVMTERLKKAAGRDLPALAPIFDPLSARHSEARDRLETTLTGTRFGALKGRLIEAPHTAILTESASLRSREVLPKLVASAWIKLARRGRALRDHDPDEAFHETRIHAKRTRYAAEAVAPALASDMSEAAAKFARKVQKIQDVLGEHQDATVAAATVAKLAEEARAGNGERPMDFDPAVARLIESQRKAARKARKRFFRVWAKLDRRRNVAWLES